MRPTCRLATLALLAALVGCEAAPPVLPDAAGLSSPLRQARSATPSYVHRAAGSPRFHDEAVSLTVLPGHAGEAALVFEDGSPFATFQLPAEALVGATLNGAPVPQDRPITITLRRADESRFYVRLEPSGLSFNPAAPPSVVFSYTHARLPDAEAPLEVWRQHRVSDGWTPTETTVDRAGRRARGRVPDFSGYTLSVGHRREGEGRDGRGE